MENNIIKIAEDYLDTFNTRPNMKDYDSFRDFVMAGFRFDYLNGYTISQIAERERLIEVNRNELELLLEKFGEEDPECKFLKESIKRIEFEIENLKSDEI